MWDDFYNHEAVTFCSIHVTMSSTGHQESDHDDHTTTTPFGSSTSSSRLRRLDRLVIDQSSLLDEDDQIEYINQLNNYNRKQYHKYRKLIVYFYVAQIVAIMLFCFNSSDLHDKSLLFLTLISVLLNVITILGLEQKYLYNVTILERTFNLVQSISVLNLLISIEVIYVDLFKIKVYYFGALIVCNYALPRMHRSMFNQIGESVKELDKLKYKYKNV